jgi:hypothetical protein
MGDAKLHGRPATLRAWMNKLNRNIVVGEGGLRSTTRCSRMGKRLGFDPIPSSSALESSTMSSSQIQNFFKLMNGLRSSCHVVPSTISSLCHLPITCSESLYT